jgi:protein-L-isoaspartate O-methyltransferase
MKMRAPAIARGYPSVASTWPWMIAIRLGTVPGGVRVTVEQAAETTVVRLSRAKRCHLSLLLASRSYRLARSVLPRRWMAHRFLNAAWASRRLAWEQVWYWLPAETAMESLRPESLPFVRASMPVGSKVIDLGGGRGLASVTAAQIADRVVYVDSDPANVAFAHATCAGRSNIEFIQGDALSALEDRGPFDVGIMLHFLEHIDEPELVLKRLRAQCRRLVIEVPDFGSEPLNYIRLRENLPLFSDTDHVTEFTEDHLGVAVLVCGGWKPARTRVANGTLLVLADHL